MQHRIFDYESSEQLLHDRQIAGLQLPFARETGILKTPLRLGQRQIENRLAAQPVEGFDALPDGSPSEKNMARYRAYAAGMSGMIWLESVSVCASGRSNPSQLWLRRENVDRFRCLADEIRTAANSWGRPYTVVQLTHSGRYSGQHSAAGPESAFHNPLIPKEHERILTDGELSSLEDDYLLAAQLAQEAGFDAVDVRACHGYLINELLAAREREGRYGGGFENRARFLLDVVEKIRAHTEIEVAVRLNVYDALAQHHLWNWGLFAAGDPPVRYGGRNLSDRASAYRSRPDAAADPADQTGCSASGCCGFGVYMAAGVWRECGRGRHRTGVVRFCGVRAPAGLLS